MRTRKTKSIYLYLITICILYKCILYIKWNVIDVSHCIVLYKHNAMHPKQLYMHLYPNLTHISFSQMIKTDEGRLSLIEPVLQLNYQNIMFDLTEWKD